MLGVREARFGRDLHQRQIGFREQFFHTIELHAKDFGFRRASEVFVEAAFQRAQRNVQRVEQFLDRQRFDRSMANRSQGFGHERIRDRLDVGRTARHDAGVDINRADARQQLINPVEKSRRIVADLHRVGLNAR